MTRARIEDDYLGTLMDMKLAGDVLTIRMRLTDEEQVIARARINPPPPGPAPCPTLDALIEQRIMQPLFKETK